MELIFSTKLYPGLTIHQTSQKLMTLPFGALSETLHLTDLSVLSRQVDRLKLPFYFDPHEFIVMNKYLSLQPVSCDAERRAIWPRHYVFC